MLGRKGRGRMFLPGSCFEDNVDESGGLVPLALTDFADRGDAFLSDLEATGGGAIGVPVSPVLLHSTASLPTPITGFSPARLVGWIRGRIR